MKLIVGLGNPGERYADTRHNIGFMVIDRLVAVEELPACKLNQKFRAELVEGRSREEKLLLVKPMTMMNLSGETVGALSRFYKLESGDVWVIHDDIDLGFGKLRIRLGGSSGGHRGVESVIGQIGAGFWRFRVGVAGFARSEQDAERYVLEQFNSDEQAQLAQVVSRTASQVESIANGTEPAHDTIDLLSQ